MASPLARETKFKKVFKIFHDLAHAWLFLVTEFLTLNIGPYHRLQANFGLMSIFVKFHWNIATPIPLCTAAELRCKRDHMAFKG